MPHRVSDIVAYNCSPQQGRDDSERPPAGERLRNLLVRHDIPVADIAKAFSMSVDTFEDQILGHRLPYFPSSDINKISRIIVGIKPDIDEESVWRDLAAGPAAGSLGYLLYRSGLSGKRVAALLGMNEHKFWHYAKKYSKNTLDSEMVEKLAIIFENAHPKSSPRYIPVEQTVKSLLGTSLVDGTVHGTVMQRHPVLRFDHLAQTDWPIREQGGKRVAARALKRKLEQVAGDKTEWVRIPSAEISDTSVVLEVPGDYRRVNLSVPAGARLLVDLDSGALVEDQLYLVRFPETAHKATRGGTELHLGYYVRDEQGRDWLDPDALDQQAFPPLSLHSGPYEILGHAYRMFSEPRRRRLPG